MKPLSRLFKRLWLAAIAIALFLLIAESACRLAGLGYPTRFLIPFSRAGQAVWIDNQLFGYRFFAPAVSRAPAPIVLPKDKKPGELRVVLLGESAAMGEPEPALGPVPMLERLLQQRYPGRQVTVINAAMTAINSHVIREIVRELPRMNPDVVVLYIGNNEVVGPFGPGTVFQPGAESAILNRLRVLATRLRFASALRAGWQSWRGSDREVWRGMEMFTEQRVAPDDPRLQATYRSFGINLEAIVDRIVRAGASPVLCTVAVNLASQAPLDGSQPGVFSENSSGSLEEYKAARDADQLRFRADGRINEIIRDLARRDARILLADVEAAFEAEGPPGDAFFLDHVHFNLTGSFLMAGIVDQAIALAVPGGTEAEPSFRDVTADLGWNPYNALDVAEIMADRINRPPFTLAFDHRVRMTGWVKECARIRRQIRETPLDGVMADFRRRSELRPGDLGLPHLAVRALLFEDRYPEASEWLHRMHQAVPHRADVRSWMAIIAAASGKPERAWAIMTDGAPPLGEIPADLLVSASETLLQAGLRDASVAVLESVAIRHPNRSRLQTLLASRLVQAGRMNDALALFERLASAHPGDPSISEEYALALALTGRFDEAEKRFAPLREANDPEQRMKYVQFLLFSGKTAEASVVVESIVAEHPAYAAAWRLRSRLQASRGSRDDALASLERASALEPWVGEDLAMLGGMYDTQNRPADAINAYEQSLSLLYDPGPVMRALAWLLATESDDGLRTPVRALELIQKASDWEPAIARDPYTLHVLAAALAANGNFDAAAREAHRAADTARTMGNLALAEEAERARALFAKGEAIRINR